MRIGNNRKQIGFTYMGLLMILAISSIAMAGLGVVWHKEMQREREMEFKFVGESYRKAIGSYYETQFNGFRQFPEKFEDLLLDARFPAIKRHIRTLYLDPMTRDKLSRDNKLTPDKSWGLVLQEGRIVGVHSLSDEKMLQQNAQDLTKTDGTKYSDLKFVYVPTTAAAPVVKSQETANAVSENTEPENLHPQIPETLNAAPTINNMPSINKANETSQKF